MSKPKPPKLDKAALAIFNADTDEIDVLKNRLLQFEKLRTEEQLPTSYIAFEALSSLLGASIKGYTGSELRRVWPEDWGDGTVEVPATLLQVLASAWGEYKDAPTGVSLGEAFGVEGGGQGRHKTKDTQATRDRDRRLANEVGSLYVAAGAAKSNGETTQPISLEAACALVANNNNCSSETVLKAYARYNPETLSGLKNKGILKG